MDSEAEVERIRLFAAVARQRIRRLDVLLDEQVRLLALDPSLNGKAFYRRIKGHRITRLDLQVFALTFLLASLGSFLAGFWTAHFR